MVAADQILFNSHYHQDAFFDAVGPFLKNFPDYRQLHLVDRVRDKTAVIGVGIPIRPRGQTPSLPPLVLWNQRWEYDKDPIGMFEMLYAVDEQGMDFRLALTGENFRQTPTEFEVARQHFGDRIIQFGYAEAHQYDAIVAAADIVVSTANHEFFGVGVAEGIAARAFPVLPRRLSYPEMLPDQVHPTCLYDTPGQAIELLTTALTDPQLRSTVTDIAGPSLERFAWPIIGEAYDEVIDGLAGN
jgi:glycosyltransferase involved in cell wall biosynthesis